MHIRLWSGRTADQLWEARVLKDVRSIARTYLQYILDCEPPPGDDP